MRRVGTALAEAGDCGDPTLHLPPNARATPPRVHADTFLQNTHVKTSFPKTKSQEILEAYESRPRLRMCSFGLNRVLSELELLPTFRNQVISNSSNFQLENWNVISTLGQHSNNQREWRAPSLPICFSCPRRMGHGFSRLPHAHPPSSLDLLVWPSKAILGLKGSEEVS